MPKKRPLFILDQDFPDSPILRVPLPDIQLVRLRDKFPDLCSNHDDWEVLQQLRARGGIDGFVTLDGNMLKLEKEMVVLEQTRLTLVALLDIDNDPIAAGALLVGISAKLARAHRGNVSQVFRVRLPRVASEKPRTLLSEIESRTKRKVGDMQKEHKLTLAQLMQDDRLTP